MRVKNSKNNQPLDEFDVILLIHKEFEKGAFFYVTTKKLLKLDNRNIIFFYYLCDLQKVVCKELVLRLDYILCVTIE